MFDKILIANRGEIACRIISTARKMGVRTVAVYSEADAKAQHAKAADEAYCIGPAPSIDSYLRMDRILDVAKRTGAQAVAVGYGFLSENPKFARMCEDNGLVFCGPPASAMIAMASKSQAKEIMIAAGVPVVGGYFGADQSLERLSAEAEKIKYPIMIKAVMGGGGKGMRIVKSRAQLEEMLLAAKREGMSSFGDDKGT